MIDTLAMLFAVLTLADVATTIYGIKRGASELNPIIKLAMKALKDAWPLVKVAFAALVWVQRHELGASTLLLADALMAGVVAWNVYQITKD